MRDKKTEAGVEREESKDGGKHVGRERNVGMEGNMEIGKYEGRETSRKRETGRDRYLGRNLETQKNMV